MTGKQELLARARIAEVKARSCRCLDIRDWPGFAALFTPTPCSPPCGAPLPMPATIAL